VHATHMALPGTRPLPPGPLTAPHQPPQYHRQPRMKLVQSRIVIDDVEGLAAFYARLLGVPVALNEYYVEIEAGPASVGFSKRRFTEYREDDDASAAGR